MSFALESLGWGVLHGVWIASILVGAGALALGMLSAASPGVRFGVVLSVLFAVALTPWMIGGYVFLEYIEHLDWVARNTAGRSAEELHHLHSGLYVPVLSRTASLATGPAVGAVALLWLLFSGRGLLSLWSEGATLKKMLSVLPEAPESSGQLLEVLSASLGIRTPVRLAVAPRAHMPLVSGVRRPVVLLPDPDAGAVADRHMEAILAHELAHVRRRDTLTNLLQRVAEALTPFNPLRRWLSDRIDRERERATDLLACRVLSSSKREYVQALVDLESACRLAGDLKLAMGGRSDLLDRARTLASPSGRGPSWRRIALVCAVLAPLAWGTADHLVRPAVRASVEILMERDLTGRITEAEAWSRRSSNYARLEPSGRALTELEGRVNVQLYVN